MNKHVPLQRTATTEKTIVMINADSFYSNPRLNANCFYSNSRLNADSGSNTRHGHRPQHSMIWGRLISALTFSITFVKILNPYVIINSCTPLQSEETDLMSMYSCIITGGCKGCQMYSVL